MGIRESLLNTITSVGNGDFIRIVTSAGASSKATLQNVIKSFETGLGSKSSLADSDYIRIVGSDNNLYKQSVNDVEKRIIEDYTGSSLGGATQSVKSAFSAFRGIPSNTNKRLAYLGTSANFDTITAEWSLGLGSNGPTTNAFYYVHTIAFESAADGTVVNGKQIAYSYTTDTEAVYVRHRANNAWTSWQQSPTRAEIDALNTKTILSESLSVPKNSSATVTLPSKTGSFLCAWRGTNALWRGLALITKASTADGICTVLSSNMSSVSESGNVLTFTNQHSNNDQTYYIRVTEIGL